MKSAPKYFSTFSYFFDPSSFAGMHISRENITFVKLVREGETLALESFFKMKLPVDIWGANGIADMHAFSAALTMFRKKINVKNPTVVVPTFAQMGEMSERELNLVKTEYKKLLKKAGFAPKRIEFEDEALARVASHESTHSPAIMVYIGGRHSNISILSHGQVVKNHLSPYGGDLLASALAREFTITEDEAHVLKKERGLKTDGDGKTLSLMMEAISILKDDIASVHRNWHDMVRKHSGNSQKVNSKIVLFGKHADMAGLAHYLESALKMPVSYLNVWEHILSTDEELPKLPFNESLDFAHALSGAIAGLTR